NLKREFFGYWLNSMEKAVSVWNEGKVSHSNLNPLYELSEHGEGQLAHLFRRLTGYVTHDFMKVYATTHTSRGRERIYSQEENIFFAVFIEEMIRRKSSLAQAIELLASLHDKDSASPDGLRKQMREAYKESQEDESFWDEIGEDRVGH